MAFSTYSDNVSRARLLISLVFLAFFLGGCQVEPAKVESTATNTLSTPIPPTLSPTIAPSLTSTATVAQPKKLVFYGDSALAIGRANDGLEHAGFSFVSNLGTMMSPEYELVTANYGGRSAKWGYENLEEAVLGLNPDVVSLWWGLNDLGACPGVFDRETNQLIEYKLEVLTQYHVEYMQKQIDLLLEQDIPVFVMTVFPILNGKLPWTHFDENYNLIWEEGTWCEFNDALLSLVEGERQLVSDYHELGKPVFLVDVWQLYHDHPYEEKMYMDIVHPASRGVQLIAEEWLRVFQESQNP